MSVRLLLTDEAWAEIDAVLQRIKSKEGSPPQLSDRLFIEAVLYVARTGIPWRDLPKAFGNWPAVYNRFRRWEKKGTWQKLWDDLQKDPLSVAKYIFIDSTCVRAHQHAAGAQKKNGDLSSQALGRSRGGFSTKIHLGCLNETRAVSIELTGGETHDAKGFDLVFQALPQDHQLQVGVMDKGYDSDEIRQQLKDRQMDAVIPPRSNRKTPLDYDKELYKQRNKVERFINRMKQFRRIATRYEKLKATFLAFIHIVAACVAIF